MQRLGPLLVVLIGLGANGACSSESDSSTSANGSGGATSNAAATTSGGTTCADCGDDQRCLSCFSAGPSTHSCHDLVTSNETHFSCGDIRLCERGAEVCKITTPAGDGCQRVECGFFPAACEGMATCECVTMYDPYKSAECVVGEDGELELTALGGFPG